MKRFLSVVLIGIFLSGCQHSIDKKLLLNKVWVNKYRDYLNITDSITEFVGCLGPKKYKLTHDTLTISAIDSTNSSRFKLRIIKLTEDSLVLKVLDSSINGMKFENTIRYINAAKVDTVHFTFQKIFFSVSCGGMLRYAPFEIEIDSTGKVYYHGSPLYPFKKQSYADDMQVSEFTGQLRYCDLNYFKYILRNSCIDSIPQNFESATDTPLKRFIFYYNGKRRYCRGLVPAINPSLKYFLYNAYGIANLKKATTMHHFELPYDSLLPPSLPLSLRSK